jgi:hypothetical protein
MPHEIVDVNFEKENKTEKRLLIYATALRSVVKKLCCSVYGSYSSLNAAK